MFDSVAEQILAADPSDLAAGINVVFGKEIGMDAGGLTKVYVCVCMCVCVCVCLCAWV